MAAVRNATGRLLGQLLALGADGARRQAPALAEHLMAEMAASAEATAANAASLVPPAATVVTCSYSSAVRRTCQLAREAGKALHVIVVEPGAGRKPPSLRLVGELRGMGIQVEIVASPESDLTSGAHLAVVGADAVTPSFIVNATPTLALAHAVSGRMPFYAVAEPIKFIADVKLEPGYDRVPLELTGGIVTEVGILAPTQVGYHTGATGHA